MSSKLLRPHQAAAVQPVVWPAAGRPAPAARPPGAPETAPAPADPAADAARQIAALRAQAEQQVREARQAGRREGEAAGREAAQAELRPLVDRFTRSIGQIVGLRASLAAEAEAGLLKLAVAIARRILHREISLDGGALAGIARAALERLQVPAISRIRAHPAEAPALSAALGGAGLLRGFDVEADPALERGAVLVDTARGRVDASVETQLAEIERGLADRLRSPS